MSSMIFSLSQAFSAESKRKSWKFGYISVAGVEYLSRPEIWMKDYWRPVPDSSVNISLLRINYGGKPIYYIYKRGVNGFQYNELPDWQVANREYFQLANSLFAMQDVLPPTLYKKNGNLVSVQIQYLYPPAEQNLFELYSWPLTLDKKGKCFYRVFQKDVFIAIRDIFEESGYRFIEVESNG